MRPALAVVISLLLLSACTSATNGNGHVGPGAARQGKSSAASASSSAAAPAPDLAKQLLSLTDLPAGWAVDNTPSTDNTDDPPCLKRMQAVATTAQEAHADFVKGADFPALSQVIGRYDSSGVALDKFQQASALLTGCGDISFDSDGTHITGTIAEMSFPAFGDHSRAWRIQLTAQGVDVGVDTVLIQKGAEMELIGLLDLNPSTDDLQSFCRTAAAKLP